MWGVRRKAFVFGGKTNKHKAVTYKRRVVSKGMLNGLNGDGELLVEVFLKEGSKKQDLPSSGLCPTKTGVTALSLGSKFG